jgi:hypothetical protein
MMTNYLDVPAVAEFFQAQKLIDDRKQEAETKERRERQAEQREARQPDREAERAELADALKTVRETNATAERKRQAAAQPREAGKFVPKDRYANANMSDDAFRASVGRDFGLRW